MEEPLPGEGEQPNDALAGEEIVDGDKSGSSSPETDNEFNADVFAAMMQQELIAYNVSWDPLMKVLQALGASMAKQQHSQQNNAAALKTMEDQVAALQDELARAEKEKKDAATTMEKMQGQMEEMQSQLEDIHGLGPQNNDDQQNAVDGQTKAPGEEKTESSGVEKSPRSPRPSSIGRQPFVTSKELADAKKELRKELKRALAQAFGHDAFDETDENDVDGVSSSEGTDTVGPNGTPRSARARGGFQLPGAPFASAADLEAALAKLSELRDEVNGKLAEHAQHLDALKDGMGKLNELSSQLPTLGNSTTPHADEKLTGGSKADGSDASRSEPAASTSEILDELKELKAVVDDHEQKLREHDELMDKYKADIKTLTDSLDDLNVQQQTVASMYAPRGTETASGDGGSGQNGSAGEASDTSKSKAERPIGRPIEASSQPQLDLSLVFTKLADLRRSTDASLNELQQTIKGVSGTTQSQQEQLDALRNNVVFTEHLQVHLVEARLAMQKELLARNQTFQDRTKPQLVEWRKGLELTEDKLLQGSSDDESLHALQQMQRCYHRTLLSIAPLVNSPLSIAETLQVLSDEVKQLQNAIRLGVVPLRISDDANSGEGAQNDSVKDEREEEYARKLRYLDEEIDATLQVNISTEKKNDPLIKGLDAMREKLELLWSMWHRNFNADRDQPSGPVSGHDDASNAANGADSSQASHEERRKSVQQRNPDGLREIELRLMGTVRRLAMVEEDIERLNALTAGLSSSDEHKSSTVADSAAAIPSRRSSTNNLRTELVMEEMEKLRKELYGEIAKISAQLPEGSGNNSSNNSSTSLVPMDRRSMVEAAAKQGDVLTDLYSQMTGRELDTRLYNTPEGQKQFYDNFIKEVTKKVTTSIDKAGNRGPGIGGAANANVNYRLLLDNFAQKVDDRLEDAREFTAEEMARLRRELLEQLKLRFEVALRDLRGELMLLQPTDGDSTAMGTKPVMCVACSRPVPVSSVVREAGSLPAELTNTEPINPALPIELDYDRPDDDFVFRAGFKMPANDRKILTLPFLTNAMRSKMVLNKPEGKRKRPVRQSHLNRVDNVVREALELDRVSRGRGHDAAQ